MKRFLFILMAAVMLTGTTLTAFAMDMPSDFPPVPTDTLYDYHLVVKTKTGDAVYLFTFEKDVIYYDSTGEKLWTREQTKYSQYEYKNGIWDIAVPSSQVSGLFFSSNTFYYSNFDLKDENGNVVFPLPPVPLAEEIMGVTEATMEVEMPKLSQTALVVVLCGVGCLALVTSLVLLHKVLPRFLG